MNTNISNLNRGKNLASVRRQSGFTLIELVIVLAVLGALAAIAVPQLTGLQEDAELAGTATTISSEAGNQFANQLLEGDSLDDWSDANACGTVASLVAPVNSGDFSLGDLGSDSDPDGVAVTVPTYNSTDDEVDSRLCDLTK